MDTLQPLKFHRILVLVDESPPSMNSLAVAAGMARGAGVKVLLAHVIDVSWWKGTVSEARALSEAMFEDLQHAGEKLLDRMAASDTLGELEVEKRLLFGNPPRALLEAADRENIDLIVMGSHGRGAFGTMILGSVSQRVIHDAKVPVVVVPPHLERAEEVSP